MCVHGPSTAHGSAGEGAEVGGDNPLKNTDVLFSLILCF